MAKLWKKAIDLYMVMGKREQILVVVMVLFVTFMLWYAIVWGSIESRHGSYTQQLSRLKQESRTFRDDISLQNSRLANDPNSVIEEKRAKLQEDIKKLDVQLGIYGKQLLSSKGMLTALKDITVKSKGIEIRSVDVLPDEEQEGTQEAGHLLYRHGVRITFLSDYFTTMAYMQKIEELPWRLFWDKLEYRVKKYPEAEVSLVIHTLSDQRDE